ncbi:MAG: type II toxin-antitoxin system HicB family antitoxin [Candidatus Tumulicola sp.]
MRTAINMTEEVKEILNRPYTRELVKNEDGTWFARVVEFTGCMTEGDTSEAALESLEDAMAAWIEVHLEDNDPIPMPRTSDQYSGKFLLRVPKTLHRELARRADLEGVSLNQYALSALSRCIGAC